MSSLDSYILTPGQNAGFSVADDLDIMLARKRVRRISSASAATLLSRRSDEIPVRSRSPDPDITIRATANSGAPAGYVSSRSSFQGTSLSSGSKRGRSASNATSILEPSASLVPEPTTTSTSTLSQRNLEHVISSRLFETFVTLSTVSKQASPPATRERTLSSASRLRVVPERSPSPSLPSSTGGGHHRSGGSPSRGTAHSSTLTPRPSTRFRNPASPDSTPRPATSKSLRSSTIRSRTESNASSTSVGPPSAIPFYLSPLHAPSTNPSWADIKPRDDFSPGTDMRGCAIQVALWARVPTPTLEKPSVTPRTSDKGKGREELEPDSSWKVLATWDVDLEKLQPFSPNVRPAGSSD